MSTYHFTIHRKVSANHRSLMSGECFCSESFERVEGENLAVMSLDVVMKHLTTIHLSWNWNESGMRIL